MTAGNQATSAGNLVPLADSGHSTQQGFMPLLALSLQPGSFAQDGRERCPAAQSSHKSAISAFILGPFV